VISTRALLELTRPLASVLIGVLVLVDSFLVNPSTSLLSFKTLFSFITGFSLTAAAMAVNDYFDFEIDTINEPLRPLPSNSATKKSALVLTVTLSAAGLVFAYLVSSVCFVMAAVVWVMMLVYSTIGKQKGVWGNLLVSTCVAMSFLYGSLAAAGRIQLNVLLFAAMVFSMNTGREITKGIVDIQGDRNNSIKTLAVVYGERKAAEGAAAFYVATMCLSFVPLLLHLASLWIVPFALPQTYLCSIAQR
jgi:geranylgeranylglycerol-phosphate geranylgeranyltransferase